MKKMLIVLLVLGVLFTGGCKVFSADCNEPYFEFKRGYCCLDENSNFICDNEEGAGGEAERQELSCSDECSEPVCDGRNYIDCVKKADGCYDAVEKGKFIGKCGVECVRDSDCSSSEECSSNKCVGVEKAEMGEPPEEVEKCDEGTVFSFHHCDKLATGSVDIYLLNSGRDLIEGVWIYSVFYDNSFTYKEDVRDVPIGRIIRYNVDVDDYLSRIYIAPVDVIGGEKKICANQKQHIVPDVNCK